MLPGLRPGLTNKRRTPESDKAWQRVKWECEVSFFLQLFWCFCVHCPLGTWQFIRSMTEALVSAEAKKKKMKRLWPSYVNEVKKKKNGFMFWSIQPSKNIERKAKKQSIVNSAVLLPCHISTIGNQEFKWARNQTAVLLRYEVTRICLLLM